MRVNPRSMDVVPGATRALPAAARRISRHDEVAVSSDELTPMRSVRTGAEQHRLAFRHDARRDAVTPAAAMLADLIHRMGGANTSAARGAYVNLRV